MASFQFISLTTLIVFVIGVLFTQRTAVATFTYPDDLHYEARISKVDLISHTAGGGKGLYSATALPLAIDGVGAGNYIDRHPPSDASFYSAGFTDEHHRPKIDLTLENGALVKVAVSFPAPYTLAMPAFTVKVLTARADHTIPTKYYRAKRHRTAAEELHDENEGLSFDERKHETIMEETLVTPNAQSEAANFALHDPTPMEDIYDYIVVIINVHPRVITSFVYELDMIPDDIFESEKMFDLTPFNSTMHMKFVAKYDKKEDALGIWVVRRPPIPDFTLLVSIDGKVEMTQNVADPSPSGQGFPHAVTRASKRKEALFRFVVHFYERARQHHVCFPIRRDLNAIVEAEISGEQNVRKFVDQSVPNLDGFGLRFTNDNHKDTLTVSVVQPHPISSFMLSLYASYSADSAPVVLRGGKSISQSNDNESAKYSERPILIFREEEHHVPYIPPTETSQFGWYSALPMKKEALVRLADARNSGKAARVSSKSLSASLPRDADGEGDDDFLDDVEGEQGAKKKANSDDPLAPVDPARSAALHLSACVSFNDKEGHLHPFEEMGDWLEDYGGNIKKMTVTTRVQQIGKARQGRYTKSDQGLAAREEIDLGEEIATVPYRVLLNTITVEGNEWVREVMKNATSFVTKCVELGMEIQQNQHFMLITFFLLMQPSSVYDGTNWRQYFETIPLTDKPAIPIFLSKEELSMFDFAPLMKEHVRTMTELIEAEYQTIANQVPWFKDEVPFDKYSVARSQVENRVFNISGTLVMIPALDYLGHSDDPSVALSFDDKEQYVRLQARRMIPNGSPLTIDYGIEVRNKFDFFTQFGFVPKGAADVAGIRMRRHKSKASDADEYSNVFLLATNRDTRAELVTFIREDIAAAKSDLEGETVNTSMVTQTELRNAFLSLLRQTLADMPQRDTIKLPPTASAVDSRASALLDIALSLYDGQKAALEQHIKWASDVKIPL